MAHCVYSDEKEIARMKENGVFIAHCPESNMNLASGVAPVRRFLEEGLHVGLGSDVAGGTTERSVPGYGPRHPGIQAPLAAAGRLP